MNTYFIFDGSRIKIGKSNNPNERLANFQTSSAPHLTLLLVLPGDHEKELHKQFASDRVRGEWFTYSYEIRKFISDHTGQPLRMPFYTWLLGQRQRVDDIGRFAVIACSDPRFPRQFSQLVLFRHYYNVIHKDNSGPPNFLKHAMEQAHAEWRRKCTRNDGKLVKGAHLGITKKRLSL